MWRQRSRVSNLKEGDGNTKYFNMWATSRNRKNFFKGVKDVDGEWKYEQDDISRVVMDYYIDFCSSTSPQFYKQALAGIQTNIKEKINQVLIPPFHPGEVYTLFQMHPTKAQGLDGMNANFSQKRWHMIGKDVADICYLCVDW